MGIVLILHNGLSDVAWMFFLLIGLWGGYRAVRGEAVDGSYLGACAVGTAVFIVQAVFGFVLLAGLGWGDMLRPGIHVLYGLFAILFLPFIYIGVLKGDDSNRGQWVLAFCNLFLFGIALRTAEIGREIGLSADWSNLPEWATLIFPPLL